MGAKATSALAIAVVPYGQESKVEGTLHQMLAGALGTLHAAGCNLIGGHTCEGAELSLGARLLVDSPAQHPDLWNPVPLRLHLTQTFQGKSVRWDGDLQNIGSTLLVRNGVAQEMQKGRQINVVKVPPVIPQPPTC